MAWDATTEESTSNAGEVASGREPGLGLVVLWSRDEPWRAGEVLLLPPGDRRVCVFGRGDDPPDDAAHHRLRLVRQRPGHNGITPPLGSSKVSRSHLRLQRLDARSIAVENLGRRAIRVRGKEVHQAVIHVAGHPRVSSSLAAAVGREGGASPVIQIQGELLLMLVERPAVLPALNHASPALPGFGGPCSLGLVGESPGLWELRDQLALAARDRAPTLVHGTPGAGLVLFADAAQRASARPVLSLDLATIPTDGQRQALFGTTGLFAETEPTDVILHGLDALAPTLASELVRVLLESRVALAGSAAPRPFEGRIIATTTRLDTLPSSLRGAFHHLVRALPLDERRDDLPFLALSLLREIIDSEALFRARHSEPPMVSLPLMEVISQLPIDGGLPVLRAVLVRSLALSNGKELIVPPELVASPSDSPATPNTAAAAPATAPSSAAPMLPADVPASVATGLPQLTKSERVVLQHLAQNKTSRDIGKTLFVSVRTVQNHRARICEKLGLRGNNALLGVAVQLRDFLGPPP